MSFLQVGALWALPLVLMPIVIHLVQGRNHQTTQWAAMMFLQRAMDARRGPTKLRRWLILALRVAIVAGLIFALARPLSSGIFGFAAGRVADSMTPVVLLDRSPSMMQRLPDGRTRLRASLETVTKTLDTLGVKQALLIESVRLEPMLISDLDSLVDSSISKACSAKSDMMGMLLRALEYLNANDLRQVNVWVCSDRQVSDWQEQSSAWNAVKQRLADFSGMIRFYQSSFADSEQGNSTITVTSTRTTGGRGSKKFEIGYRVRSSSSKSDEIPVRVTVGDVTQSHRLAIDQGSGVGRLSFPLAVEPSPGKIAIASDVNTADDTFYFVAGDLSGGKRWFAVV